MANIDGQWDTVTQTPMGEQKAVLTITRDGDSFTGTQAGAMGSVELTDGRIDGNRLTWRMALTKPIAMTLDGEATIDGDTLAGTIKAGMFGKMPLSGKRIA